MERTTPIVALAVVMVFGSAALADLLAPGVSLDRPGQGLSAPCYTAVLPSYFVPGNEVTSVTEPIVSYNGHMAGTVVSTVYQNPSNSQLTFEYRFTDTGSSDLLCAEFDPTPWVGVTIYDAGADGTGTSVAETVSPDWTNGDPIFIGRDQSSYPFFQWDANGQGTALLGPSSGASANIWLSTNGTGYQMSYTALLDGGAVGSVDLLAPAGVAVVPGPMSILAGLQGLGMLLVFRKKVKSLTVS
jgi:hypothetical protein